MFYSTSDEQLVAVLYSAIDNELAMHEKEKKMFKCKIVDRYSKSISKFIRSTITDDVKLVIYATNCRFEINPGDKIEILNIGKFKVENILIDYNNQRFRNFGMNSVAMKMIYPKIISLR